ncbi:MAG: 4Fe-4S double cluster binding domain-containing protein [Candidatus Hodarchaeota archaeon]
MFGIKKAKGGLKQQVISMDKFGGKRFEIDDKELVKELYDCISRIFNGLGIAKKYKKLNKAITAEKVPINQKFWDDLIDYTKSIGIDLIGFTEVDEYYIFEEEMADYRVKDKVLDKAIVLGKEMKKERIEQAPEPPAGVEAMRIYAELGEATNKLAKYIRDRGYQAQAFHPFGGPVLYPPMAEKAGLGELGNNGLIITREFGPSQRLSMIATDASPLPKIKPANLGVKEICKNCKACIKACPGQAIYPFDKKIKSDNGKYITSIDNEKCFPSFFKHQGCSICIKVCPFFKHGYEKVMKNKQPIITATIKD